ncbi:hypothetical protein DL93DRAFT_1477704 [Clavulina sp. PMI_390]|nr:hypothetical protein DL93DRAFT_1477704 [Clavulina sp. PMI_390]
MDIVFYARDSVQHYIAVLYIRTPSVSMEISSTVQQCFDSDNLRIFPAQYGSTICGDRLYSNVESSSPLIQHFEASSLRICLPASKTSTPSNHSFHFTNTRTMSQLCINNTTPSVATCFDRMNFRTFYHYDMIKKDMAPFPQSASSYPWKHRTSGQPCETFGTSGQ